MSGCRLSIPLWSAVYTHSILSTVVLALDRYLTISCLFSYHTLMTRRRVGFILGVCSFLPFIFFITTILTTKPAQLPCIPSHNQSRWATLSVLQIVFFVLLTIFFLYFKIIFVFWRLKRTISVRKRNTEKLDYLSSPISFHIIKFGVFPMKQSASNVVALTVAGNMREKLPRPKNNIQERITRLGRYIRASKPVMLILFFFTICWLPWIRWLLYICIN